MPDLNPDAVLEAVASDPRLRVFVDGGRIKTMPARQSRRRLLLDVIAQAFEPGVRYYGEGLAASAASCVSAPAATRRCGWAAK